MNTRKQSRRVASGVGVVLAAVSVVGVAATIGSGNTTSAREAAYAKPCGTTMTAVFPGKARQFVAINATGKITSSCAKVVGSCEAQALKSGGKKWKFAGFGPVTNGRCVVKVKFPDAGKVQARIKFSTLTQFKDSQSKPVPVLVAVSKDTVKPRVDLGLSPENAFDAAGVAVTFFPAAFDDRDGNVPVTCIPASGSVFPVGQTTVTCTAKDKAGNVGTATEVQTVTLIGGG